MVGGNTNKNEYDHCKLIPSAAAATIIETRKKSPEGSEQQASCSGSRDKKLV